MISAAVLTMLRPLGGPPLLIRHSRGVSCGWGASARGRVRPVMLPRANPMAITIRVSTSLVVPHSA